MRSSHSISGDSSKPSKQQSDEMIASNNVKTEAPSEKLISTQAPPRPKEEFPGKSYIKQ